MDYKNILLGIVLLIGVTHASSYITISNVSPNTTYQLYPTNFSVTINDTAPNSSLTNITWELNGTTMAIQNVSNLSVSNGTFYDNFTWNYTGTYNLTILAFDNQSNSNSSNFSIVYNTYVLPQITQISPQNSTINTSAIWMVTLTPGSFPLSNVTWDFPNNNYLENLAVSGANYQIFQFNQSGTFSITVQVCDVNSFCSQSVTQIYISSTIPTSYWTVGNAQVITNLTYLNNEVITLDFIPYNDTNPIYSVQVYWGDNYSDTYKYTGDITSESYTHMYGALGNYSISATVCDTIGNCYNTFISNITYSQNILGTAESTLLSSNAIYEQGANGNVFQNFEDNLSSQFGNTTGQILFYVIITIAGALLSVLVLFVVMTFSGEAIKKFFR